MQYSVYLFPFLSVLIGYLIALFVTPKNKKNIKLLLAFSGSFLLSLTVMHLLPGIYAAELSHHDAHEHVHSTIGLYIMLGIVFQIVLEYFSKGAEHGHVHGHEKMNQIPWLLFISLCVHAVLEGIPINNDNHLAFGIAIHHLPIAMILTLFFKNAALDKTAILFFMVTFAAMTPAGTLLAKELAFIQTYQTQALGFVVGILFHISSTIIFETSEGHKFNLAKLLAIAFGIIIASFM